MPNSRRIDGPSRNLPRVLQILIVGRQGIRREVGGLLAVVCLTPRADAARRPDGIQKVRGEGLALLHEFRDLLQKPVLGIQDGRSVAAVLGSDLGRYAWKIPFHLLVTDHPRGARDRDPAQGAMVIGNHHGTIGVGPQLGRVAVDRIARMIGNQNENLAAAAPGEGRFAQIAVAR